MADAPKDSDQSMEDILQSIKRIIADEGEAAPAAPEPSAGSDVLELTELLAEDVAVPAPAAEPASNVGSMSLDDIMADVPAPVAEAPPAPEPAPVMMPAPEPVMEIAPEPVHVPVPPAPVSAPVGEDKLMSDSTLAASMAALSALSGGHRPMHTALGSPVFRSGTTVEDLVIECLRPMLKEWLDANLPSLVRQLVEKEIRRLSGN